MGQLVLMLREVGFTKGRMSSTQSYYDKGLVTGIILNYCNKSNALTKQEINCNVECKVK